MTNVNLQDLYKQLNEGLAPVEAVPLGTYNLEVTGVKATDRPDGGYQLVPVFKVVDGPYAGRKVLAGTFVLNAKAAGIFGQNMAGFGLTKEFFDQMPSKDDVAAALKGRQVTVELIIEPYKGENRNKIPIGKIKLISAPPLPAIGGVPAAQPQPQPQPAPAPEQPAVAAVPDASPPPTPPGPPPGAGVPAVTTADEPSF